MQIYDLKKYNHDELWNLLNIVTAALKLILRARSTKNYKFWVLVRARQDLIGEIYGTRFQKDGSK